MTYVYTYQWFREIIDSVINIRSPDNLTHVYDNFYEILYVDHVFAIQCKYSKE